MYTCKNCDNKHIGEYWNKEFCSKFCARSFTTKFDNSKETKDAICIKCGNALKINKRASIKKARCSTCFKYDKECKLCLIKFSTRKKTQEFCSNKCATKFSLNREDVKEKINNTKRKNNSFSGWNTRGKNIRSYPEKFFIEVLKNNNLFEKCLVEYKIKKRDLGLDCSANYFLDFYFPDIKLDLEIDGKQHKYPERISSDIIRDKALKNNGYKVYRIDWNEINSKEGKKIMKTKIDNFLNYITSVDQG